MKSELGFKIVPRSDRCKVYNRMCATSAAFKSSSSESKSEADSFMQGVHHTAFVEAHVVTVATVAWEH